MHKSEITITGINKSSLCKNINNPSYVRIFTHSRSFWTFTAMTLPLGGELGRVLL